jgi:acetyl/propionyl-CoA carboxylase alpha subunit/acetyl-CoA carboxylase carboxyltransferase component
VFSRIAIINRGEAAMRLIHAVAELNAEHGDGLRTIALHSDAERGAMFVREADEAECIGVPGGGTPNGPRLSPYLDHRELERALRRTEADAAWVGWGFVAEDPGFAELCARIGVVFIGPDAQVMRRLGDKVKAKLIAQHAGVPVAPWSEGPVSSIESARRHAQKIGFPLMVKAAAGGGGRGIRMVNDEGGLADAFERARSEGQSAFGDPTVFLEKLLTDVRHVEVQIVGDNFGVVWAVGVRDCSVQRRNQKVIEESASTVLSRDQETQLSEAAVALATRAGYRNAGTVEFLYQPATATFAFLEVNTRLQVEHPVTEVTTGLDLVKLQLHVAGGGRLGGTPPAARGHAIEARLNAEDPDRAFAPSPGLVDVLAFPSGPGIRVDTGIAEGDVISPDYDSMVAKVIAWGRDRDEARARLRRALAQTRVVVRGGTTNKAFLVDVLDRPEMRTGQVDTRWLDRLAPKGEVKGSDEAGVALLAAAIEASDRATAVRRSTFYASAARGRPEMTADIGELVELRHEGQAYRLAVKRTGPARYRIVVDGQAIAAGIERLPRFERRLTVARRRHRVVVQDQGMDYLVEVDVVSYRLAVDDGGVIRAPASGVVVVVPVQLGDVVAAGDTVAVVESMKMEVAIPAPTAGRVREVCTSGNVQVDAGAPLVRLDPVDGGAAAPSGDRVSFRDLAADDRTDADGLDRCRAYLEILRCSILGFELDPGDVRRVVDEYRRIRPSVAGDDPELLTTELNLLTVFADLAVLWRNRRGGEDTEEEEAHSPIEYLNIYLRSLDTEREGLPAIFRERLQRALAHYGVTDLARTPELEESMYWIFHAQHRAPVQLEAILALLEQRLQDAGVLSEASKDELLDTLDRLIVATQLRYPVIGELARSIRYRWFDRPVIQRSAAETLAAMRTHLAYLDANPGADDYDAHLDLLVSSPQAMIGLLAERDPDGGGSREPMLEVLTRRYYKIRQLGPVRSFLLEGRRFVTARFPHEGRTVHVVASHVGVDGLAEAAGAAARLAELIPAGDTVVVDLYVRWKGALPSIESLNAVLETVLNQIDAPPAVTRFAVVAIGDSRPEAGQGDHAVSYLTFRPKDGHMVEDKVVRGLHPMIATRLQLWRLANFDIDPLPTTGDLYLFHCIAKDNPQEERLVAVAEVRDLTPVLDHSGRVAALPELEHTLGACLDALRRAQADRPPERRLRWNRVLLHVWAPIAVPLDELLPVAGKLAPLTAGLGLEAVLVQGRFQESAGGPLTEQVLRLAYEPGAGLTIRITDPPTQPMRPLDTYTQKVINARRRGAVYPYELIPMLTRGAEVRAVDDARGTFTEYDLDPDGRLVAVDRPPGGNQAGVVVGVVSLPSSRYPEGMTRVVLLGDPTKGLGSIAEPECRRVLAALDLASELDAPVEWFALSSGAKIAMDSGTENMDWVARVLRRLIEFTQAGGEVNVVVAGINVGAQPYWNAEATMLMHTRGILVMTPDSAMVLTGKQALEYSGGVSAEDNVGIGGYERIMGPNGQAQYWAPDLAGACDVLLSHYEHSYVAPGERFPRRAETADPVDRDVTGEPHVVEGIDFRRIGDIFSEHTNPGRKKPFDIRSLMRATLDHDHPPLERWAGMREADTVVVWDGHLGGYPVAMLGVESRPLPRFGPVPADGPDQWSAGTLFPLSSKKMARAINGASGSRPLVILANLSGFDGSPESLRRLQLEYGAEIGRAVVNFDGPIVFCVVSRYHGGAFVVFSGALNDHLEVAAVEGSHASVIGGAPAAAVVFAGEVNARTRKDPRVRDLEARIAEAAEGQQAQLRNQLAELRESVRLEYLGQVAAEFDAIHTVERAQRVGSVDKIIPAAALRPYLVDAVERGIRRFES